MFGVLTLTLKHFLGKTIFFQRVWGGGGGGVHKTCGNSGGVGGYFCVQKMEIPGRREDWHEIPFMVGVWIFSGTTHCIYNKFWKLLKMLFEKFFGKKVCSAFCKCRKLYETLRRKPLKHAQFM